MFSLLLLVLSSSSALASETCAEPVPLDNLDEAVHNVEIEFSKGTEPELLAKALSQARAGLPCVDDRVNPTLAAQIHLAEALDAFVEQPVDTNRVTAHLRAMLRVKPDAFLAESVAGNGTGLDQIYDQARAAPPPSIRLLADPLEGSWLVDGIRTSEAPGDVPAVVQHLDPQGSITWTGILGPGKDVPPHLVTPVVVQRVEASPVPPPPPDRGSNRRTRRIALWTGAGVALIGSGAMLAKGASATSDYRRIVENGADGTEVEHYLEHARNQDRALTQRSRFLAAGGLLGGLGVALGVAGAF